MRWQDANFIESLRTRTDVKIGGTLTVTDGDTSLWIMLGLSNSSSADAHLDVDPMSCRIKSALTTEHGWPVGTVMTTELSVTLLDTDRILSQYNLIGSVLSMYISYTDTNGQTSSKTLPTYYVCAADDLNSGTVTLTALEGLAYRTDVEIPDVFWTSAVSFPVTLGDLTYMAMRRCAIACPSGWSFTNSTVQITKKPEDVTTYRDLLGAIAEIAGGNMKLGLNVVPEIAYPGDLVPSSSGINDKADRWIKQPLYRLQKYRLAKILAVYTDADGVARDRTYTYGGGVSEEDAVLDISQNPLLPVMVQSQVYLAIQTLWTQASKSGRYFYTFEGTLTSQPYWEPGDGVEVVTAFDNVGNPSASIVSFMTEVDHQFNGPSKIANAIRPARFRYT